MALWRNIGGVVTLAAGGTHFWEITYPPNGRDVGVVVMAPNIQQSQINVELLATDQGVVARPSRGEGGPEIHYTARIRNAGAIGLAYNLNVGDWQ